MSKFGFFVSDLLFWTRARGLTASVDPSVTIILLTHSGECEVNAPAAFGRPVGLQGKPRHRGDRDRDEPTNRQP